ncbi:MAG: hypothetical protein IIA60_00545 [Candidatus Marinimicrobia bacterium]|nr:hypothetical protein [Candidatus Neomarinimicrobiota bacterium]
MFNGNMEQFKSEPFRMGWMGESIERVVKHVRAAMEIQFIDKATAVKRKRAALQAQVDALSERAIDCRARIEEVFGARSPEAPFVWIIEKVKLMIYDRGLDRLNRDLEEAESRESILRDRIAEETTKMELLVLLEYEKGKHLRRMTGMKSINQEGTYDVLGIS